MPKIWHYLKSKFLSDSGISGSMIFITLFPLLWFHRHKYIACLKAGKEKQRANKTMASLFGSLVWLDCQAKERQIWGFKARQCFCRKNFKYVQVLQISTKVCFDLFLCVPLSKLRQLCDPIVCCIIIVFSFSICLFWISGYYTTGQEIISAHSSTAMKD